jgi:hypothetical protein
MIYKIIQKKAAIFFKKISPIIVISIVVLIFGVGLYFSILLPKIIAIIIMSITSSVCTLFIFKTQPNLTMLASNNRSDIDEDKYKSKIKNLKSQLERVNSIGLKIAEITDIHEVGLKKITLNITDYKEVELSKKDLSIKIPLIGKWNNKNHIIEFKGVLSKSISVKYGLDLSKIKFLHQNGVIYISNTQPKYIGCESNENIWKLRELRSKIEKDDVYSNYEIISDSPRLIEESDLQEKELMQRISNNLELGEFTSVFEEANKNYIRETLFHLKIEIKFVDSLDSYVEGVHKFIDSYKTDVNNELIKAIEYKS